MLKKLPWRALAGTCIVRVLGWVLAEPTCAGNVIWIGTGLLKSVKAIWEWLLVWPTEFTVTCINAQTDSWWSKICKFNPGTLCKPTQVRLQYIRPINTCQKHIIWVKYLSKLKTKYIYRNIKNFTLSPPPPLCKPFLFPRHFPECKIW